MKMKCTHYPRLCYFQNINIRFFIICLKSFSPSDPAFLINPRQTRTHQFRQIFSEHAISQSESIRGFFLSPDHGSNPNPTSRALVIQSTHKPATGSHRPGTPRTYE